MGKLKVTVISARDLEGKDVGGTSDPYVQVTIAGVKKKTDHITKTCNPTWNTTLLFDIPVTSNASTESATFEIYDYDRFGGNDIIGKATIALGTLYRGLPQRVDLKLTYSRRGTLTVELLAEDFGQAQPMMTSTTPQLPQQPQPQVSGYQQPQMQGYQQPQMQGYPQQPQMQGYPQQPMQTMGYQQQPPQMQGYPQQPPMQGYPQQPPMQGYPQQPMQTMGYQQQPPQMQGYPQQPMQGYPQQPQMGYPPQQQPMQPMGYQQPMQGYPQQPMGYPPQPFQ